MSGQPENGGGSKDVGYCKPPRKNRWKKGQSGNPRGRPRKSHLKPIIYGLDPATKSLLEQDEKRLTVRTPDGEVEMRRSEAVQEKLVKLALGGNLKAIQLYLGLIQSASQESDQHKAELQRLAIAHVENYGSQFRLAEAKGRDPPAVFPHPEDFVIDENYDVHIVGPVNHWQQLEMEQHHTYRDACDEIIRDLEQIPDWKEKLPDCAIEKVKEYRGIFNAALPPRLRTDPPESGGGP